ncbi:hypothetical protein AAG570_001767 [Ranatra chinensis]|uniref:Uncharacterized protein n=1 Tax=Ranatra chinensis TaxID=642074 RepID=A0ABD0YNH7_9HEMI
MASKRRNTFYQNKKQETTEIVTCSRCSRPRKGSVGCGIGQRYSKWVSPLIVYPDQRMTNSRFGSYEKSDVNSCNEIRDPITIADDAPATLGAASVPESGTDRGPAEDILRVHQEERHGCGQLQAAVVQGSTRMHCTPGTSLPSQRVVEAVSGISGMQICVLSLRSVPIGASVPLESVLEPHIYLRHPNTPDDSRDTLMTSNLGINDSELPWANELKAKDVRPWWVNPEEAADIMRRIDEVERHWKQDQCQESKTCQRSCQGCGGPLTIVKCHTKRVRQPLLRSFAPPTADARFVRIKFLTLRRYSAAEIHRQVAEVVCLVSVKCDELNKNKGVNDVMEEAIGDTVELA